jgi:hypothetical protein
VRQRVAQTGIVVAAVLAIAMTVPLVAAAEVIPVRFSEGVARGFPVLRTTDGTKLAQGDLTQIAHGDRVESRLVFRFTDGSLYDETVVFSQDGTFRLLDYRIVQHGPSFPESLDGRVERTTGRYAVRYRADEESPEQVVSGRLELPDDVYNGMIGVVLKNLAPGRSAAVQILAFTPRPRIVKLLLEPAGRDAVFVADVPGRATRYLLKPQLGMFASLLIVDLAPMQTWILEGPAPSFLKFEGPLYFMGPTWRIELQ